MADNKAGNGRAEAGCSRTTELLAPAGDMERLRMALTYGADAVYLAGTRFWHAGFCGEFFG
jgi:collagenase-like PrtC family protease